MDQQMTSMHLRLSFWTSKGTPPFPRSKIWWNGPSLHLEIDQIFHSHVLLDFWALCFYIFLSLQSSSVTRTWPVSRNDRQKKQVQSVMSVVGLPWINRWLRCTCNVHLEHPKVPPPPFQGQKFDEMALVYILKLIRFFTTIFCQIFGFSASTSFSHYSLHLSPGLDLC